MASSKHPFQERERAHLQDEILLESLLASLSPYGSAQLRSARGEFTRHIPLTKGKFTSRERFSFPQGRFLTRIRRKRYESMQRRRDYKAARDFSHWVFPCHAQHLSPIRTTSCLTSRMLLSHEGFASSCRGSERYLRERGVGELWGATLTVPGYIRIWLGPPRPRLCDACAGPTKELRVMSHTNPRDLRAACRGRVLRRRGVGLLGLPSPRHRLETA